MGLMKRMTMVGAKEMRNYFARVGERAPQVLAEVLYENAVEAMAESQKIVPHAEGTLAGSGVVQPPEATATGVSVSFGYGGAAAAYAERQHEDLTLSHPDPRNPNSRPSGEAKFLERPARERIPRLREDLKARMEQEMKP